MVAAEGTTLGKTAFFLSKVWVLLLPVAWLLLVERRRPSIPRPSSRGMAAACATGAAIVVAILTAYWFLGSRLDRVSMRETAHAVGLETSVIYLLGALYWCTVNSILEEYVWRWFVFTRLEVLMPRLLAVAACGLAFTLHHIIALKIYFPEAKVPLLYFDWPIWVLASLGVFLGGATWSWLYLRYRNIWAAYVSHVFADVVIFAIGWRIIFG